MGPLNIASHAERWPVQSYPEIRTALSTAFSIQTGLSDANAFGLFRRMLENRGWRERFERELLEAFSSPETPWRELLQNDSYEVTEPDSEEEARDLLAELLWRPTFPGKVPPKPRPNEGGR